MEDGWEEMGGWAEDDWGNLAIVQSSEAATIREVTGFNLRRACVRNESVGLRVFLDVDDEAVDNHEMNPE